MTYIIKKKGEEHFYIGSNPGKLPMYSENKKHAKKYRSKFGADRASRGKWMEDVEVVKSK